MCGGCGEARIAAPAHGAGTGACGTGPDVTAVALLRSLMRRRVSACVDQMRHIEARQSVRRGPDSRRGRLTRRSVCTRSREGDADGSQRVPHDFGSRVVAAAAGALDGPSSGSTTLEAQTRSAAGRRKPLLLQIGSNANAYDEDDLIRIQRFGVKSITAGIQIADPQRMKATQRSLRDFANCRTSTESRSAS